MLKDQLKLQFVVLVWGFTGVLGILIELPAIQLVFWRTLIASVSLLIWLSMRGTNFQVGRKVALQLTGTGVIVGIHWMFFYAAVKVGGASLGMIGLSTATLWVALLSPLFDKRRISLLEMALGIVVIAALCYIVQAEMTRVWGLVLSIIAAFLAAVFASINGRFAKKLHHNVIAFYEMVGAFIVTAIVMAGAPEAFIWPTWSDWLFILILAVVCTVYAYAACVELLKRLSVFVVNLSVNLEPVYGMALAALFLGEHHLLTRQFYQGSAILIVAVIAYPILNKQIMRRQQITQAA